MVPKQTINAINENKLSSNRVDANFKTKAPNDRTLHRNKMKIMDGSKKRATLLHFRVWIWVLSGCMLNQINTCFVVTIGSIFESRLRYWNKLKVKENSLLFFSVLQLLSLFFSINWLIKFKTMKYSKWCSSFFFLLNFTHLSSFDHKNKFTVEFVICIISTQIIDLGQN